MRRERTSLLRKRTLSRRKRTFFLLDKPNIVKRTDVFNSNTFIVYDIVIPYGTENKLFYLFKKKNAHAECRMGIGEEEWPPNRKYSEIHHG